MLNRSVLTLLSEADEARDARMRSLAESAFAVLVAWVQENYELLPKLGVRAAQFGGWAVPWKDIDRSFKERQELWWSEVGHVQQLTIVFADGSAKSGIGNHRNSWLLVLPVLKEPFNLEYLNTRIEGPSARKSFIHEFVHYLDKGAYRARFDRSRTSSELADGGGQVSYFIHPAEFNAFFQEGAHELDKTLSDSLRVVAYADRSRSQSVRRHFLGRARAILPERAIDFVRRHAGLQGGDAPVSWDNNFLKALHTKQGAKWLRKFEKRLVGLHRVLSSKYAPVFE